jgi:hypothetical protein
MFLFYRNIPTIALINEVDITTTTLNELVQNMNDITNREKELQRQQVPNFYYHYLKSARKSFLTMLRFYK